MSEINIKEPKKVTKLTQSKSPTANRKKASDNMS